MNRQADSGEAHFALSPERALSECAICVPAGARRIAFDIDIPKTLRIRSFFALRDANGAVRLKTMIGWASARFCIGESGEVTSLGGVPGAIPAGEWTAVFGAVSAPEAPMDIGFRWACGGEEIEAAPVPIGAELWTKETPDRNLSRKQGPGWFAGDYHVHTVLSDGKLTPEEQMRVADEMALDVYAPTEHNLRHTGWCAHTRLVIPGVEATSAFGHWNLIGIRSEHPALDDLMSETDRIEVERILRESACAVHGDGGILVVNHPFMVPWEWSLETLPLGEVDAIELINDPTYPTAPAATEEARAFLEFLHDDGWQIPAFGGSDAHNRPEERYEGAELPSVVGDPTTWVYAETLSESAVLGGVRRGRVIVSRYTDVEFHLTADGEPLLPGDGWREGAKCLDYCLVLRTRNEMAENPTVTCIVDGVEHIVPTEKADGETRPTWRACGAVVLEGGERCIHWEARTAKGITAYVNPVYGTPGARRYATLGEALEAWRDARRPLR